MFLPTTYKKTPSKFLEMDFQITIHSISARSPKHSAPWFVKVRTDACYLYKTRALTGVDLDFREKFDFAEWDKSIKMEVWKSESSGVEFSLVAVVPLDFPVAGSYSTSFDVFSEKATGLHKSSNSSLISASSARTSPAAPAWRDPIAHVKVTVVHLSGFKARSIARLRSLEDGSHSRSGSESKIPQSFYQPDETKSVAAQSMKVRMPEMPPARQPSAAQSMRSPTPPEQQQPSVAYSPRSKPTPPIPKPKWTTVCTEEGDEYYFNTQTEETTWDKPDDYDGR